MVDSLSTPSLKSGNVLALLNTLYTSGFAMASSSTPLLKGKTMHALYAISFIVYVSNCVCDWVFVCLTVKGRITSFPLNTWMAVVLVLTVVTGTMLTWLLLVLCIENAFAHRLDITPYRSGCALVFEAFIEWTQAFNNFRVSFLIMALHDAPMTIINFFFITSCRCPNPKVCIFCEFHMLNLKIMTWPVILSSSTTCISLIWRILVLYFSYRRMVCVQAPKEPTKGVSTTLPPMVHFRTLIDTSSLSKNGRLDEYDEVWPIRWARLKTLGPHSDDTMLRHKEPTEGDPEKLPPSIKKKYFVWNMKNIISEIFSTVKISLFYIAWILLSAVGYIFMFMTCCMPCIYHYTCRKNSFHHRHKLCRSFIRYFSSIFHYTTFITSLLCSIFLIGLNIILLSSVHGLGSNSIPPEIDQVCVTISPQSHTIFLDVIPKAVFETRKHLYTRLNKKHAPNDLTAISECKPMFEDGGLGIGLVRRQAGIWQMRVPVGSHMIAVSTQISFNHTDDHWPEMTLRYEYAFFVRSGPSGEENFKCVRNSMWLLVTSVAQLDWPYFAACQQRWTFTQSPLIECDEIMIRRPYFFMKNVLF